MHGDCDEITITFDQYLILGKLSYKFINKYITKTADVKAYLAEIRN